MELTTRQREAVQAEEREVLVIAGAGSGKTRVLTERVKWLLAGGASPADLLVLTFTRAAAGELRDRLEGVDTAGMLLGTFHSIALTILRSDGDQLGYETDSLTVLDPSDADLLLRQVCSDLGYLDGKTWRQGLSWATVTRYREAFYTGTAGNSGDDADIRLAGILNCYHDRLRDLNTLDFGRILTECHRLLERFPEVLERWRDRIKHVLVDELQDTDTLQYRLHGFFAPPATFFGVGDPRQTIYRWRGARPDLMVEQHPEARVIHLQDCFRCGERIVDAANRLIDHNAEPLSEPMLEQPPGKWDLADPFAGRSADIIARIRVAHYEHGYAWDEIAVLGRRHDILRRLAALCDEHKIPYHRVGGAFDVCETDEFRLLHAALRLCVNPRDDLAFLRLREALEVYGVGYAEVCARGGPGGHWRECSAPDNPIWQTIEYAQAHPNEKPVDHVALGMMDDFDDLKQRDVITIDVSNLSASVGFWTTHCSGMSIPDALRWFALRDAQDDLTDGNQVTLATVHAAKGLEWPCVLLAGCQEGTLPSSQARTAESKGDPSGIMDERRVAYVAMTRASERLAIHYRRPRDQNAKRARSNPSRFITEAGFTI